jgi:hypothetical protein
MLARYATEHASSEIRPMALKQCMLAAVPQSEQHSQNRILPDSHALSHRIIMNKKRMCLNLGKRQPGETSSRLRRGTTLPS